MNDETLQELSAFKVWAKQNPEARRLLREIIFRWRGSSARLRGDSALWAAYSHEKWREWLGGVARRTFERRLTALVDLGLIDRERHRFAGTTVYAWLRPTALALKHAGTVTDMARLERGRNTTPKQAAGGTLGGSVGGTSGGALGGTDHTSLPSSSTEATKQKTSANKFTEGKGKAGENETEYVKEAAKKELALLAKETGVKDFDPNDPEWTDTIQQKGKKLEKLLAKFPRLKGKHEKHVKHPYELNPKWASWSPELQAKRYAVYKTYVANWYAGNGGKPAKAWEEMTEEAWAEVGASMNKLYEQMLIEDEAEKAAWLSKKSKNTG